MNENTGLKPFEWTYSLLNFSDCCRKKQYFIALFFLSWFPKTHIIYSLRIVVDSITHFPSYFYTKTPWKLLLLSLLLFFYFAVITLKIPPINCCFFFFFFFFCIKVFHSDSFIAVIFADR